VYGKRRQTANLREHVAESLATILSEAQTASNEALAALVVEVNALEAKECELESTGGDRATLRGVRQALRNKKNAITVLNKGHPEWEKRLADPGLYRDVVLVPVDQLPLRVAKFDVVLREDALQATRAMHAVLSRMVMFWCKWCNESFPTFHPAYDPADADVHLELRRAAKSGVPACSVEVASWERETLPSFPESEDQGVIAEQCRGVCLWCQRDMDQQQKEGAEQVVPRRSYLNHMDPCWKFPHEELGDLFASATVTEAMLIALEHMQVSFVTMRKTGLERFRKNTISFPQDIVRFAVRMEMLGPEEYRVGDRVNSRRGPGLDVG